MRIKKFQALEVTVFSKKYHAILLDNTEREIGKEEVAKAEIR